MRVLAKVLVAVSLIAGIAVLPTVAGAQPASWTIRPSVSPASTKQGDLHGVACAGPSSCFAVGSVVQRWNGAKWTIVKNVVPAGDHLNGIACPSASMCIAVGVAATKWNGTSWSNIAFPAGASNLGGIACTSTTHCFAFDAYTLHVFEWNGTGWTKDTVPALADGSALFGVACASTTRCFAVGSNYVNNANNHPLIEQWDGTSWTVASAPNLNSTNADLQDVSCLSATMCMAVGFAQANQRENTVAERWNGTTWTRMTTPNPPKGGTSANLVGVACSSTTACFAISDSRLILRMQGTTWTTVANPAHASFVDDLADIVCPGAKNCLAVGVALPANPASSTPPQAAGERWNGTKWSEQTMPQLQPSKSALLAVGCKVSVCFAVGQFVSPGNGKTAPLIERASAAGWKKVNAPQSAGAESVLTGVACPTTTACFAVGRTLAGKTVAMAWHGNGWSVMKTANKAGVRNKLTSIACVSATNCWAVGRYDAGLIGTLIEHWNGTAWTIVPSPSRKPTPNFELSGENDLQGITCVGANFCLAVGSDTGSRFTFEETLVLQWNGTKWSLVKSANGGKYSNLAGIVCASATNCWAVGDWFAAPSAAAHKTLIEHWNGTAWTHVPSPNPAAGSQNQLLAVACPAAKQCVAVGGSTPHPTTGEPIAGKLFAETLSGGTWHLAAPAVPAGAVVSSLNGVACANAQQCNAVGAFTHTPATQTLAELFH